MSFVLILAALDVDSVPRVLSSHCIVRDICDGRDAISITHTIRLGVNSLGR